MRRVTRPRSASGYIEPGIVSGRIPDDPESAELPYRDVVLEASMGAGKTTAVRCGLTGSSIIFVSPLRKLSDASAVALGATNVATVWVEERSADPSKAYARARERIADAGTAACTANKLTRRFCDERDLGRDTLVIDEAEQVLTNVCLGATFAHQRRQQLATFLAMINEVSRVVVLDATADQELWEAVFRRAGRHGSLGVHVKYESAGPPRGTYHVAEKRGTLVDVISSRLAAGGNVFVGCSTKKATKFLGNFFRRGGWDPLVIVPGVTDDRVEEFIRTGRVGGEVPQLVIASPAITSGLSIPQLPDGRPAYGTVVIDAYVIPGCTAGLDDMIQMAHRVRGNPDLVLYVEVAAKPVQTEEQIRAELLQRWEETHRGAVRHKACGLVVAPDWSNLLDLSVYLIHRQQVRNAQGLGYIEERLLSEGWTAGASLAGQDGDESRFLSIEAWDQRERVKLLCEAPTLPVWHEEHPDFLKQRAPDPTGPEAMLVADELIGWSKACADVARRTRRGTALDVAWSSVRRAHILDACVLPLDSELAPDSLVMRVHAANESKGGVVGLLARLEGDPLAAAGDRDARAMGRTRDGSGAWVQRQEAEWDRGSTTPVHRPAEPCSPIDAPSASEGVLLALQCLRQGGIDPYEVREGTSVGVVEVSALQLTRIWNFLRRNAADAERLGIVRRVAADKVQGRQNVRTLFGLFGLADQSTARDKKVKDRPWYVGVDPELVGILERRAERRRAEEERKRQLLEEMGLGTCVAK